MRRAHIDNAEQTSVAARNHLDLENDQLADELKGKVKALKKITIDIGQEVRDQNRMLGDMDSDFDKGKGFLQSTMKRVTALAKSGQHCHVIYLLLFAAFVFFVLWIIIKTR